MMPDSNGVWREETGTNNFTGTFEAGKTYSAVFFLRADVPFADSVTATATADGETLEATAAKDGEMLKVIVPFTIPAEGGTTPDVEKTDTPTINYDDKFFTVSAGGNGTVKLYKDGEEVSNPCVLTQTDSKQTYVFTATAQAEGKEISDTVTLTVVVPAKEVEESIKAVSIDFDLPEAGDVATTVTPNGTVPTGVNYEMMPDSNGVWREETGTYGFSGTFEAGKTYSAVFFLRTDGTFAESVSATATAGGETLEATAAKDGEMLKVVVPFTPAEGGETPDPEVTVVTGITIDPVSAEVVKGNTQQFTAEVSGTGDFSKAVAWSVSGGTASTINADGLLTVGAGETAETLTVTVKSVADNTKTVTATVTVNSAKYTITYTDGVEGKVIFTDKVFENVVDGSDTPAFGAAPTRSGYTFKGWSPAVAEKVTGNQTYTATWQKRSSGGSYGGGSYVVPDKDADSKLRIVMQINNKNILVNGKTMVNDVAPVIVADRTLVPIRVVTELLGGSAHWDNATRTVTLKIDGKTMNMTIGKEIPGFGTSAVIMNDRTYVPVRYVMEKLGADVEWINATRQIIIEK